MFCPIFHGIILSASGLNDNDAKRIGTSTNGIALAAASLCRVQNPEALALHFHISTVLFHSGVKSDDLNGLNCLGVCMSPDSMIRAQNTMCEQLEGKVLLWKKAIEQNKGALLLGEELMTTQIPNRDETDMEINVEVKLEEDVLKNYGSFTTEGYGLLQKEMEKERAIQNETIYTDDCLREVLQKLKVTRLPLYR